MMALEFAFCNFFRARATENEGRLGDCGSKSTVGQTGAKFFQVSTSRDLHEDGNIVVLAECISFGPSVTTE